MQINKEKTISCKLQIDQNNATFYSFQIQCCICNKERKLNQTKKY
jgi:hypothetical protein